MKTLIVLLAVSGCSGPHDETTCDPAWTASHGYPVETCESACQAYPSPPIADELCRYTDPRGLPQTCSGIGLAAPYDSDRGCCVVQLEHTAFTARWHECE